MRKIERQMYTVFENNGLHFGARFSIEYFVFQQFPKLC